MENPRSAAGSRGLLREDGPMAKFIVLKRPGPPTREVLVNIAQILTVQPGQGTGSSVLFGKDHAINFEEDVATVIRRIQSGPFIESAEKK